MSPHGIVVAHILVPAVLPVLGIFLLFPKSGDQILIILFQKAFRYRQEFCTGYLLPLSHLSQFPVLFPESQVIRHCQDQTKKQTEHCPVSPGCRRQPVEKQKDEKHCHSYKIKGRSSFVLFYICSQNFHTALLIRSDTPCQFWW